MSTKATTPATRWERVKQALSFVEWNLAAAERCERNGTPSELREADVRRSLEQAIEALDRKDSAA